MNKMDKIKQEQMEKLSRIQTGDYSKLQLNWKAIVIVGLIVLVIINIILR